MRAFGLLVAILDAAALLWWVSGGRGGALDDSVARPAANEQARERLQSAEIAPAADSARRQNTRTVAEVVDDVTVVTDDAVPAADTRRLAGLVLEDGSPLRSLASTSSSRIARHAT